MTRFASAALGALLLLTAGCASTQNGSGQAMATADPMAPGSDRPAAADASFDRDRQAILAMAGTYDVTFNFVETVALTAGYEPKEPYRTGGLEVVRVIKDTGREIVLQHLLLVGEDHSHVVKHWRQDWVYEPATVLVFKGRDRWETRSLSAEERAGKWSQAVYQVDDSPRYAAVAAWEHDQGVSEWTAETWRPLPRRDATKRDDYDVMVSENTHAITPQGWVHEQVNGKLKLTDSGANQLLVREIGYNTYYQNDGADIDPAIAYWDQTQRFWAEVRDHWTQLERTGSGLALDLEGEGDLYSEVLAIAEDVRTEKMPTDRAVTQAVDIIDAHVAAR